MSEASDLKVNKLRKRVKAAVGRSRNVRGDVESEKTLHLKKKGVRPYGKDGRSRRVKDDNVLGVDEALSTRENAERRIRSKTKSERFGSDQVGNQRVEPSTFGVRNNMRRFSEDHYGDEKLNNREYSDRRGVESNNRDNRIRGGKGRHVEVSHGDRELNSESHDRKRKRIYADRSPDDESTFQENLKTSGRKYLSKAGSSKFRDDMVEDRRTGRGLSHDSEQSSWKKSPPGRRNSSRESNDERGSMNWRGTGKSFDKVKFAERGESGNGGLKKTERSKFESSKRFDQKNYTAKFLLKPSNKKFLHKKTSTEDAAMKDSRPKKKKRVHRLDPHDLSNKRMDDDTATIDSAKEKKEDSDSNKNAEMSMNAQFRAIQPSPAILSFVEDNLLGRRREIEFRNAGYNIELPVPLDNIPESSERARIEETVFRNKLEFYAAAKISSSFPPPDSAEIAFAGRSNVGKSSLLNALTRQWGVARTSDKPGLTQTINFFNLGAKVSLVDLPGYGFAYAKEETKEAWEELVKEYVSTRVGLKRVCLLIDTKWGMKQTDHELIDLMERSKTKYQIILTKTDLSFPIDVARRAMQIEQNLAAKKSAVQPVMMVSSKTGAGIRSLRTVLSKVARFVKL